MLFIHPRTVNYWFAGRCKHIPLCDCNVKIATTNLNLNKQHLNLNKQHIANTTGDTKKEYEIHYIGLARIYSTKLLGY